MQELTPHQARERLTQRGSTLLDVREHWEHDICRIAGALHIPMGEIAARLHEIERDADIIVLCHHGVRSRAVAAYLCRNGYHAVSNLDGGIDAWARTLDPDLATY